MKNLIDEAINNQLIATRREVRERLQNFIKRHEDIAEQAAGTLSMMMDAIIFIIWEFDSWNIVHCNQAAAKLFGLPIREIVGQPMMRFARFDLPSREDFFRESELFFDTGFWFGHMIAVSTSGEEIPVYTVTFLMHDAKGTPMMGSASFRKNWVKKFGNLDKERLKKSWQQTVCAAMCWEIP